MSAGAGTLGYFGIAFQDDLTGQADATSVHFLPFVSESLVESIPRIETQELRYVHDEGYSHQGLRTVAGDIVLEPTPYALAIAAYATMGVLETDSHASYFTHKLQMRNDNLMAGAPLPPFTCVVGRDVSCAQAFWNCQATGLTIDLNQGDIARLTLSIIGGAGMGDSDLGTPSFQDVGSSHMPWNVTSIALSGAASGRDFTQLSIAITNPMEARPTISTSDYASNFKRTGFRQVRVNGSLDISSLEHYNRLRANASHELEIHMAPTANEYVTIGGPAMVYEAAPYNVGGPGPVSATVTLRAHPDVDSGTLWMASRTVGGMGIEIGSGNGSW
jgi:hypothetical protein